MMRSALSAVLVALATIAASLSLEPLFDDPSWLRPAVLAVGAVTLVGILVRTRTRSVSVLMSLQLLCLAVVITVLLVPGTLWYGLPTAETVSAVGELLAEARTTITRYSAPAPTTLGVTFALVLVVGLAALAADLAAATAESPAAAGLAVLALYLVGAANAPSGLPWTTFALPAALWLVLLGHESRTSMDRWVSILPLSRGEDTVSAARRDFTRQAVGLGVAGLAVAVAAPALIPHLPSSFVADGFKTRGAGGGGGSDARSSVRLSSEIDLRRSLGDRDPSPVLRYRTDDPSPPPLRVGVAVAFDDGRAQIPSTTDVDVMGRGLDYLGVRAPMDRTRSFTVVENRVRAPQMPAPYAATALQSEVGSTMDPDGVLRADGDVRGYTVSYREQREDLDDIERSTRSAPTPDGRDLNPYLAVDPSAAPEMRALATRLAGEGDSPLATAQAIQEYLRGPDFTYDLQLDARRPGEDPITHFLRTKRGYCQQFAATMVQLARAAGIPARFVVGFLPGTATDGEWVVRAADAHAWPELYVDGAGWLRFEPTPGGRAAAIPSYSLEASSAAPTAPTSSPSSATARPSERPDVAAPAPATPAQTGPRWWPPIAIATAVLALLAVLPLTALLLRRRARRGDDDEVARVEREWRRLVDELTDLGVSSPPGGATPRQAGEHLAYRAGLDQEHSAQLAGVVDVVEHARYAPPGAAPRDISRDVDAIIGRVRTGRARGIRARATLAPGPARRWWRGLPSRLRARRPDRRA